VWRCALWGTLLVCALPGPVSGAPAVRLTAQAGWSGWIPPGDWIPLRVDVVAAEAVEGVVVADVPVPLEHAAISFRRPVRLGPGVRQRITLDILVPDVRRAVAVRLVSRGRDLARTDLPLDASRAVDGVVLAVTREPAGLELLADLPRRLRPAYISEADLPSRWQGYAGVQLLAVRDIDERAVSPAQQQALEEWVLQGGRLVVTGDEQLVRLRAPWLMKMLPAVPTGLTVVRNPAELPGVGPIPAAVLSVRQGASARGSLVAQWRWGAGAVTVWAFDAFAPGLRAWPARAALWETVLHAPVSGWLVPRELADALPASRPLPGGVQAWLALVSILYVLAVRRALRRAGRLRSGWLAVIAVALAFTLAMYGFALQARRAGTTAIQASAVELIPDTGMARVRSALVLISPYGGTFALAAPSGAAVQPVAPYPLTFDGPEVVGGRAPASGLRFDAQQIVPMPVEGRVVVEESGLRVEVENHSALAIRDALVFRNGQIYRLPRLEERASIQLDPAQWETFARQANPPADAGDRLLEEVLARLPRRSAGADSAWLVGRIVDPRLAFRGRAVQIEAHELLVLPLQGAASP